MADLQPIARAFPNGGLMLKQDPALLDEKHYSELTNMVSVQEGNLTVRAGSKKLTTAATFSGASNIHSISSLHVTAEETDILYVGEGENIWSQVNGGNWDNVARGVAPAASAPAQQRFSAVSYSAGSSGLPFQYFACPSAMLKDNGMSPVTSGSLQNWGILPPTQPAQAALGAIVLLPASPNTDVVDSFAAGATLTRLNDVLVLAVSGSAP